MKRGICKRKHIAKTLTWLILATTDTFIIAWFITGEWNWAGAIAGMEGSLRFSYIIFMRGHGIII
tara:strand:- start:199 stop:393 length:195 start_codon:yes stop_codon:yes gene_type:complete